MGNQKRKSAERRRKQRLQLIAYVVLIALAIGGGAVTFFSFSRGRPSSAVDRSPNEASRFAGGLTTLVYGDFADTKELHRLDLVSNEDLVALELPLSGDTTAAPGSDWMTIEVVEDRDSGGLQPVIHVFNPSTGTAQRLGVGVDPKWSPDGTHLVWAQPSDPEQCGEDKCLGDISVVVTEAETGDPEILVEPGPHTVIGWSGDYVLIEDNTIPEQPILQSVSPLGEIVDLPIRAIDYWGASPDGRYIVESGESGATRFLEMADGRVTGQGDDIGIRAGTKLGAGAWAHDSSAIAAFALGDDGLGFVTFSPVSPEPVTLADGGEASTGITLWSPDNDAVIFQRFTGDELEAVHCPIDDPAACEVVLSWIRGIALLRIE